MANCLFVVLSLSSASLCHGACVEVDSDTDAVGSEGFKLGCISCKMRGEVPAEATVEWSFMPKGESEFTKVSRHGSIGTVVGYIPIISPLRRM